MRSYLLLGTALALSSSLAYAQSAGSTGSGSTTSTPSTTPSTSAPSQPTAPTSSPNQTTPQGAQTTTPQTTTPSGTNTNSNSRTGATGTDRQNPLAPPNTPSSVTPAVSPPNAPGSYNPSQSGGRAPNQTGISGGSTAGADIDLKHGTRVAKLKDAKTKIVGLKLVDAKGEAIGEVASVKTLRSGKVTKIVVDLEAGGQVTLAAGPVLYLADNNMLVTRQSARSIQRMHHR